MSKDDFKVECESLLDYFAGQALAGMLAGDLPVETNVDDDYDSLPDPTAHRAYDYAAAMLAERARRMEQPK